MVVVVLIKMVVIFVLACECQLLDLRVVMITTGLNTLTSRGRDQEPTLGER